MLEFQPGPIFNNLILVDRFKTLKPLHKEEK